MTKRMAQRYLSLVPDDITADDDTEANIVELSSNEMSNVEPPTDEFFCQDEESYPTVGEYILLSEVWF